MRDWVEEEAEDEDDADENGHMEYRSVGVGVVC